jgi:hypothetical protein
MSYKSHAADVDPMPQQSPDLCQHVSGNLATANGVDPTTSGDKSTVFHLLGFHVPSIHRCDGVLIRYRCTSQRSEELHRISVYFLGWGETESTWYVGH